MSARRTSARARAFWIALPIAVAFALCAGPGLATDDEMPLTDPPQPTDPQDFSASAVDPAPEPECEESHDPGPDGDR